MPFGFVWLSHRTERAYWSLTCFNLSWGTLIREFVLHIKKYSSIKSPLYIKQHSSPRIQNKQSLLDLKK